jgi:predicted Zn-dependent peptidase
MFGRSSDFYNKLYEQGLINNSFDSNFIGNERYCFSIIGGESNNPNDVKQAILDEIGRLGQNGLDKNSFERLKKLHMGRIIRQFDDIEESAHAFINLIFNDIMIFDYIEILNRLTFNDISERFSKMLDKNKMAISIINPI